jgi:hypothetical protein
MPTLLDCEKHKIERIGLNYGQLWIMNLKFAESYYIPVW